MPDLLKRAKERCHIKLNLMYKNLHVKNLTLSVFFVALPTLLFLAFGNVVFMSRYFTVAFTLAFIFLSFRSNVIVLAAFAFTQFPLVNFLKGGFYSYNISTVILFIIYVQLYFRNYKNIRRLLNNKKYIFIFIFFLSYYLFSFLFSGRYNANLRAVDFILAAGLVPVIFPYRSIFKSMFFYMGIIAVVFALIIGYYGGRYLNPDLLSETEIGGGNPISYGIPVSLFLSMIFFAPKYILPVKVFRINFFLLILIVLASIALIVTTSRGAILSFLISFSAIFFLKKSIVRKIKYLSLTVISLMAYNIASTYFPEFQVAEEFIVGRAKDENMDVNKYSHNRVLMWDMVISELKKGNYIFIGAGPGKQMDEFGLIASRQGVSGKFNMNYAFHALPLQLTIELGLMLTVLFYLILFVLIFKIIYKFRNSDFILPIIGVVFWIGITMSVTGLDLLNGMAMGFFFLNFNSKRNLVSVQN